MVKQTVRLVLSGLFVGLFVIGCFLCASLSCSTSPNTLHSSSAHSTEKEIISEITQMSVLVLYEESAGSGVLFKCDNKVLVLTAAHVICDGDYSNLATIDKSSFTYATKQIRLAGHKHNSEQVLWASLGTLVTINPDMDYAILEVDIGETSHMRMTSFDISDAEIGEEIFLVGSPMWKVGTVTKGIVCHSHRKLGLPIFGIIEYIQTDAAGGPGSSGGGMFRSSDGVCIGIAVVKDNVLGIMMILPIGTIVQDLAESKLNAIELPCS